MCCLQGQRGDDAQSSAQCGQRKVTACLVTQASPALAVPLHCRCLSSPGLLGRGPAVSLLRAPVWLRFSHVQGWAATRCSSPARSVLTAPAQGATAPVPLPSGPKKQRGECNNSNTKEEKDTGKQGPCNTFSHCTNLNTSRDISEKKEVARSNTLPEAL